MLNTVFEYLEKSYHKYKKKIAIVDHGCNITYENLYNKVLQIASWMNHLYVCSKKPVIVLMNNSAEAIAAFLGIALSGNIYVPIDADIPRERLKLINYTLNPVCVISCTSNADNYRDIFTCKVVAWSEIEETEFDLEWAFKKRDCIIDTDPLYILFTSGSTGIPKGVIINHRAVLDFTEEASEAMDFTEKEIFLNQAPFYFDASIPDIYCTIRNGATLHIVDRSMFVFPIKLVDYIAENKINAIYWVPSALVMVANFKVLEKRDISSLKKIMFCGEVMPTKQLNMWRKVLPDAIFVNYYGPCEATYASCYYVVDRQFEDDEPLPIGKPARNTSIILISAQGEIKESGQIGEIFICGSGLGLGYYNSPEKTKENFVQNPLQSEYPEIVYKTGDLAHYDDDGNLIYDGRIDYQIKHMGYRIELGEIENCVNAISGVKQAACIYYKEKNAIFCYYCGNISKEDIMKKIKLKLPFYMFPKEIIQLSTLPMNTNGKIDRKVLENMIINE